MKVQIFPLICVAFAVYLCTVSAREFNCTFTYFGLGQSPTSYFYYTQLTEQYNWTDAMDLCRACGYSPAEIPTRADGNMIAERMGLRGTLWSSARENTKSISYLAYEATNQTVEDVFESYVDYSNQEVSRFCGVLQPLFLPAPRMAMYLTSCERENFPLCTEPFVTTSKIS